jgi:hypothetical protein
MLPSRSGDGGVIRIAITSGDACGSVGSPVVDRERLRDHAAHRRADDVRARDAEAVHQRDRVGCHVAQRVGRLDLAAGHRRHEHHRQVRHAVVPQPRGLADVAVVEAHDVEAARGEILAEGFIPQDHLRAETHDEHERRIALVPEGLVLELDSVGGDLRHGVLLRCFGRGQKLIGSLR